MDVNAALKSYRWFLDTKRKMRTFEDVAWFAERAGSGILGSFKDGDLEGLTESELIAALEPLFKEMTSKVNFASRLVHNRRNKALGLNINVIDAEYNQESVRKVAKDIIEGKTREELIKEMITDARRIADSSIKVNAEAHSEMGLETHIVRKYSDHGLRMGTKYAEKCQWCLDRCGDWTNYKEALAAGCFERHDGCLCEIDYHVGKTHTKSRDKYSWWAV